MGAGQQKFKQTGSLSFRRLGRYFWFALGSVIVLTPIVAAASASSTATADSGASAAPIPQTLRLDYYHTGNVDTEIFSVDQVVIEPLPWSGNPHRPIDDLNLGKYLFEVRNADGKLLYSRGFASIYGEWETTGEARERYRTFHESIRFPRPEAVVEVVMKKRDAENTFQRVWSTKVDPQGMFVSDAAPLSMEVVAVHESGPPAQKVDLLLLGDGYTAAECKTFHQQAQHLAQALLRTAPFEQRRDDFNIWAICPEAEVSGVSRPSTGIHRQSPVGATYDAFGSERYILTFDNRAWRDIAAWVPYEFVEILVNSETYGGGGIFGLFSTVAAGNDWAEYLFLHEFGHHFAGLADEYYTSSVAYESSAERVEPWEVNATALHDPENLKWGDLVEPGVPIPSPWPKETYEEQSRGIQKRRKDLRAQNRPESEMSSLFEEQQNAETELFRASPLWGHVGAFEGANYEAQGYYRPQIDCLMFSRNPVPLCAVCQRGVEAVIDLYVGQTP